MFAKRILPLVSCLTVLFLSACSTAYKARQEERNKVASSSGLYCEFINGDSHNDVDVELTLQMSKKCDVSKPYQLTNFRNASDIFGVVYCCSYTKNKSASSSTGKASSAGAAADGLE